MMEDAPFWNRLARGKRKTNCDDLAEKKKEREFIVFFGERDGNLAFAREGSGGGSGGGRGGGGDDTGGDQKGKKGAFFYTGGGE